jgi:hypothetical protein
MAGGNQQHDQFHNTYPSANLTFLKGFAATPTSGKPSKKKDNVLTNQSLTVYCQPDSISDRRTIWQSIWSQRSSYCLPWNTNIHSNCFTGCIPQLHLEHPVYLLHLAPVCPLDLQLSPTSDGTPTGSPTSSAPIFSTTWVKESLEKLSNPCFRGLFGIAKASPVYDSHLIQIFRQKGFAKAEWFPELSG